LLFDATGRGIALPVVSFPFRHGEEGRALLVVSLMRGLPSSL